MEVCVFSLPNFLVHAIYRYQCISPALNSSHGSGRNELVLVVYRPGSSAPTSAFFDDFADVLERVASYACPVLILGDVNIHLDIADDPNTIKWQSVIDSHV